MATAGSLEVKVLPPCCFSVLNEFNESVDICLIGL